MFNPRAVFGVVSVFLLVLLIVDWTSLDKESKLERSVSVQSSVVEGDWKNTVSYTHLTLPTKA